MFKKICFFVAALSILFSAESFAIKSAPHEPGIQKKSSRIAKRRAERPATKRPARRTATQRSLATKRARIVNKQARHVRQKDAPLAHRRARTPRQALPSPARKAETKRGAKPVARSVRNNSNVYPGNTGTIVHNGSVVASAHSNNVSSVSINGTRITGRNIKVTREQNGSYIIDVDGKQTVVDKPLSVSKKTVSSSTTKSRNGRTKQHNSANTIDYSFTTNSIIGHSFDPVAFKKQMSEMGSFDVGPFDFGSL